jgi:hypothetical protein
MRRSYPQALRAVTATGLGWVAAACSSGTASSSTVTLSDFPDRYAQVLCDGVEPCCAAAALAYDAAACTEAALDSITQALGVLASRQDTVYDPDAAAQCLRELASALRECSVDRAPACANLFTGTRPAGADCALSSQCAGVNAYCSADGVCASAAPSACELDATQCEARDPDAANAARCGGSL